MTAPSCASLSRLARLAASGTNTSQRTPSWWAACATAMPALPPEAMTTPAAGTVFARMRLNMPRALKLPVTWRCSSFSQSSAAATPSSAPAIRTRGVRRTSPAIRRPASAMSSRVMSMRCGESRSRYIAPVDRPVTPSARALEAARTLVRMATVSRDSNLELIHHVRDELARHGVASRPTFADEGRKANLFATIGAGKPAGVIVSGHTDTVPWDNQDWSVDPLGAEVRDGRLFGRGSADMKGFIGLAVAQVPQWQKADLPFAVHLAFSYDEE